MSRFVRQFSQVDNDGSGRATTMTAAAFKAARDFLLAHRTDYASAYRDFRWPEASHFNWALDWFDGELARG
jgi:acetyl-CoA synthetase